MPNHDLDRSVLLLEAYITDSFYCNLYPIASGKLPPQD